MRRMAAVVIVVLALATSSPSVGAAVPGKDFTQTGCENHSDSVARLYTAGLGREPERGGFEFWLTEYTAGRWGLPKMATFFAQSPEFNTSYGTLTQDGFIRQLYRNVLGREGEQGGVTFWNEQMSLGMDRGTVLLRFAESPENIANSGTVQPFLGPFNGGLSSPWTCNGWAPTPVPTGRTPGDALPIGTRFEFSERYSDAKFDGQILGLVEGQRRESNNEQGRCFFVVGTFTPTQLDSGNASRSFEAPDISLIAGGQRINRTVSKCIWDDLEVAGWRWSLYMSTTIGTGFPFFEEVFLPSDGPQVPDAIAVGNPATSGALYFDAGITAGIPNAPQPASGPNTFLESRPGLGAGFEIRESFDGVTWQGRITSIVTGTPRRDDGGTCVFVLGDLTPTVIDEGVVTSGFDTPSIHLLNRGRVIDDTIGRCDRTAIEAAGWDWILYAEVTVGTPYSFFAEIYIEDGNTLSPQAVIVGSPSADDALFFNATTVSASVPNAN